MHNLLENSYILSCEAEWSSGKDTVQFEGPWCDLRVENQQFSIDLVGVDTLGDISLSSVAIKKIHLMLSHLISFSIYLRKWLY